MASKQKTAIVTGASQGIGAGVVQSFLDRGYNVVANSRSIKRSGALSESVHLALVDGSIGECAVAARIVETAVQKFGSIDAVVNNAGIFFTKPFTDYSAEDFKALSCTNLEGFLHVTKAAVKQMLAQKFAGGEPDRRYYGVGPDDHQGRTGSRHAEFGHRVREGENSLQRSRARSRRHAAAQG
jgi:NAD(P)-dependent dehydrogenase (short-subunit alcohol dehydrogenase family)